MNLVLGSDLIVKKEEYYPDIFQIAYVPFDTWIADFVNRKYDSKILPPTDIKHDGRRRYVLPYIDTFGTSIAPSGSANVVLFLDKRKSGYNVGW